MDVTLNDLEPVDTGENSKAAPVSMQAVSMDDLEAVEAPDNSVYHEPSGRVLGLPQTLDARETQYITDKNIDGKKGFYGQVHIGEEPPPIDIPALPDVPKPSYVARGVGSFFNDYWRSVIGNTLVKRGQKLQSGEARMDNLTPSNMMGYDYLQAPETDEQRKIAIDIGAEAEKLGKDTLEINRARMKRAGMDTSEATTLGEKASVILGYGVPSIAVTIGSGGLMQSQIPAMAFFHTLQSGNTYLEVDAADKDKQLTPNEKEGLSYTVANVSAALEGFGGHLLFKSLQESGVGKRIIGGYLSEGITGATQNVAEEGILQAADVRNTPLPEVLEGVALQFVVEGFLGGASAGALGRDASKEAKQLGVPENIANDFGRRVAEEYPAASRDMLDFMKREIAPLSQSDEATKEFTTLMQKFINGEPVKVNDLTETQQELFDKWSDHFQKSMPDDRGTAAVEASWYKRSIERGLDAEQAMTSAKLMGAYSGSAARALNVSPMEWWESVNLDLEVQRTPADAVASYHEKLDALNAELPDAPGPERIKPSEDLTPEEQAAKDEEIAGFEKRLMDARGGTRDVSMKKPIINYLKKLGGIRTDGLVYGELKWLGIDRKSAVGLFKNTDTAMRDIDNIPLDEFNRALGVSAQDDGNGYVDRDWLLEALRNEQFGERLGQERPEGDDSFLQALDKAGLDYRTATAQQVYEALGADGDIVTVAANMGVELTPKEVRQVRGIMERNPEMYVSDAIDDFVERSAIMGDTRYQSDGAQGVIPGAEKATDKQIAEKGMEGRMKSSKAQKPMDEGMFGDAFKQQTLFQSYQRTQTLQRMYDYDLLDKLETLEGYKGDANKAKREEFLERARTNTLTETDLALKKDVVDAAKRVGGRLYQSQAADVSSPAFKEWFGKSKVVTAGGAPQVVYHGTDKNFAAFNPKKGAQQIIWFTSNKADIEAGEVGASGKGRIIEMYAKIENPAGWKDYDNLGLAELEARGFDGVILPEKDGSFTGFAFEPNQFKAVDNRGTFDPTDNRLRYQEGARGSITFGRDKTLINLFQNANPSTLLHELGHFFLRDMDRIAKSTRRPMVKKDFEAVKKWLGSKDGKFTEDQEEKFARGFEAYLREGKAPTESLKTVFARFKDWLTSIYQSAKDLNVEINDDVRAVFDRMLGADYAKAEQQLKQRDVAKLEQDYKTIEEQDTSDFWADAGAVLSSGKQMAGNMFTPVSSRLGRIDPTLKAALRRYNFEMGMSENADRKRVLPFLESMDKMSEADYKRLDFAMKNRDETVVNEIATKYGVTEQFAEVRNLLDDIYNEALAVGLDVAYLENYYPRLVRLDKSSEFMATLRGRADWSLIEEALKDADPMNVFTDEEQAAFVNKWLRGHAPNATLIALPSFIKDRVIDYVEPQFNRFYLESPEALLKYISAMRLGIAQKKIFGKGETAEESVGAYVLNLVKTGSIKAEQENEVKMIFNAALNSRGPGVFVSWMKNAGYIYLMGSPISAITQIGDLAFALAKNGYYNTGVSLAKAVIGKSILKKEDLGIANIAQEFEDNSRAGRFVQKTFKIVGLEYMDNLGKQTYIESAYKRLRGEAKKNNAAFKRNLEVLFGDQAASVREDLMDGTLSDNVKMLLFSELSDVQPVSLAEMPVGYLKGGNWRALYMLKTYTVKQIDTYRREIFDKMATGDPAQVTQGAAMMVRLAVALMLTGMGADALKDLILGRAITLSELFMDNLLKLTGLTKYQIYQSRQDGVGNTVMQMLFVPPLYAPFDNVIKDVQRVAADKIEFKDAQSFSYVPVVGKFYYWWVGGGRTKEDKKAGKGGKTKETW